MVNKSLTAGCADSTVKYSASFPHRLPFLSREVYLVRGKISEIICRIMSQADSLATQDRRDYCDMYIELYRLALKISAWVIPNRRGKPINAWNALKATEGYAEWGEYFMRESCLIHSLEDGIIRTLSHGELIAFAQTVVDFYTTVIQGLPSDDSAVATMDLTDAFLAA